MLCYVMHRAPYTSTRQALYACEERGTAQVWYFMISFSRQRCDELRRAEVYTAPRFPLQDEMLLLTPCLQAAALVSVVGRFATTSMVLNITFSSPGSMRGLSIRGECPASKIVPGGNT